MNANFLHLFGDALNQSDVHWNKAFIDRCCTEIIWVRCTCRIHIMLSISECNYNGRIGKKIASCYFSKSNPLKLAEKWASKIFRLFSLSCSLSLADFKKTCMPQNFSVLSVSLTSWLPKGHANTHLFIFFGIGVYFCTAHYFNIF